MSKLMSANIMRLKKDKIFRLCFAFMALIGSTISLIAGGDDTSGFYLEQVFFTFYAVPLEFVCAIFCSLFIGADYNDGTVRNKIIVGHSRVSIYLSNLLTCAAAGICFVIAYAIPMMIFGTYRFGMFNMGLTYALIFIGISIAMMLAVCAVCTLISMLCQNRAYAAVICIIVMLAMIVAGALLKSRLDEPEFYGGYYYTNYESGITTEFQGEPNPRYISGIKREIYQFLLELLPAGQAIIFTDMSFVHTWQLPLYSLAVIILTTLAGLAVFRRKDIK